MMSEQQPRQVFFLRGYHWLTRTQTLFILPSTLFLAGLSALVFGRNAAKSFEYVGGDLTIRALGAELVISAAVIIYGFITHDAVWEAFGSLAVALGALFYGLAIMIGLGTQGLVSGIGYIGISVVMLSRVLFMTQHSSSQQKIENS
jgi:hypothetical protein